jgi:hypothetical protein
LERVSSLRSSFAQNNAGPTNKTTSAASTNNRRGAKALSASWHGGFLSGRNSASSSSRIITTDRRSHKNKIFEDGKLYQGEESGKNSNSGWGCGIKYISQSTGGNGHTYQSLEELLTRSEDSSDQNGEVAAPCFSTIAA